MFEPADQRLDFARAQPGLGELERDRAAERRLRPRQPVGGGTAVAFEQREREPEQARRAEQPIGLFGEEAPFTFAARQRAARNVDEVGNPIERQRGIALEPFERPVGEPAGDAAQQLPGVECLEARSTA